ncbi:MAG TPA: HAMP domain-containing protein [Deltaproteobacteria bacterium]|nr:HAMP domain-containing protein [Deltaproteobacteria bacterium]
MSSIEVGRDSIQRRIVRGFFATTGLALLLTATALFTTAFFQFQQVTNKNLLVLARVIGGNTQASLLFNDEQAAEETLRALKAEESIEAAIVYAADGSIFARYVRPDVVDFRLPREISFEPEWSREHIDLASKIMMGEEEIGTVFIRSDTKEVTIFLYKSIAIVVSVLLISLFLCWIGATRLRNQITSPLERLVRGSASMASGDLSTQVDVRSEDEMGVLARAFNAMVLSLRELVARVGENTRYVAQAAEQLSSSSVSMREEAERQEHAVEETAESIERITSSMHAVNASVEALSESAAETESAAIEMDSSIVETSSHIDDLSEIIDTTASSVVEMTSGIREIARSADILNQSTASTAGALELLSDSVRQVESNARESHSLSDETAHKAGLGMSAVHETVEGMEKIQDSFKGIESVISNLSDKSESIGEVVKVIESVVEQTNLLALNAAIISSQAGEHGRAFSVVADEVRSLAERTAASTREIAGLIESVQDGVLNAVSAMEEGATRVERGVELSNEAGRILREIGESSQQSARWAKEIVEATRGQATDIGQVGIAMQQVKETATQLNRGTHEQDSASAEITRGVERMRHLGLEVKNAAQAQRRESAMIRRSVEGVAARIKEILRETQDQSKRADQIQEALEVFREVTIQTTRRAEQASETVADLSAHAQGLEAEIGRFRL